jgi:ATP-dependent Clp protease ATP-binding subunit ClpA
MTSNLGAADSERNIIGFGGGTNSDAVDAAVKEYFRPEFRNRVDAIVTFNKLDGATIRKVAEKFIRELNEQLALKNTAITLTDTALDWLCKTGYTPSLGARPMQRTIHEHIKTPLAKIILFDKTKNHANIKVDLNVDKLELVVEDDRDSRTNAD